MEGVLIKRHESLKDPTPKLNSQEIKQRLIEKPISKNEVVDYLLKLHKKDGKLEQSSYKKLLANKQFESILKEVKELRSKKKQCMNIV